MSKLAIQSWERNGYNDSDGYMIYLDTETGTLGQDLFWTTRGYMPHDTSAYDKTWTDELVEVARKALADIIRVMLKTADEQDVQKPNTVKVGERYRLLRKVRNQVKVERVEEEDCYKCNGTGNWTNPRNANDKRPCFGCNGKGKRQVKQYDRKKDENGKQEYHTHPEGTEFIASASRCYARTINGKIYGHAPGRFDLTILGKLDDGTFIRCPLDACCLARPELTDVELDEKADRLSRNFNFVAAYHGTWVDSDGDFIGRYIKQRRKEGVDLTAAAQTA